jgi:hypothetical protein
MTPAGSRRYAASAIASARINPPSLPSAPPLAPRTTSPAQGGARTTGTLSNPPPFLRYERVPSPLPSREGLPSRRTPSGRQSCAPAGRPKPRRHPEPGEESRWIGRNDRGVPRARGARAALVHPWLVPDMDPLRLRSGQALGCARDDPCAAPQLHRFSAFILPPLPRSPAPPLPRSPAPPLHHSILLAFQLSSFPAFQLSSFPAFQLSSFPAFQRSSFQAFKLSSFQAFKLSS